MGKAKFGASQFMYQRVDTKGLVIKGEGEDSQEPKKLPGLTEVKMDLKNELKPIAADDGTYVVLSGGISEATLDVKVLDINSEARKDWYGIDVQKGVELYKKDLTPNDVVVMFRTKMDDGKPIYVAMFRGKFSLPGIDTKTVDGTPEPNADEVTGTFAPRGDDDEGLMVAIGRADAEDFDLELFKQFVFAKTEDDFKVLDDPKA